MAHKFPKHPLGAQTNAPPNSTKTLDTLILMTRDGYQDTGDGRNGDTYRQTETETASQHCPLEREHISVQLHSEVRLIMTSYICRCVSTHSTSFQAAPPSQYLGYFPPWRAASLHMGTQERRYEAPSGNQISSGYDAWRDTQYHIPFRPATERRKAPLPFAQTFLESTNA